MNKRRLIIPCLLAALLSALSCHAQAPRPHWRLGAEWGYSVAFHNHYHYCYPDPEIGYRVDDEQYVNINYLNAYCMLKGGYDLSRCLNASLSLGSMGVYNERVLIPVLADFAWHMNTVTQDGPMFTAGSGIALGNLRRKPVILARAGVGYRFALSRWADLDFFLRFRAVIDHPRVWDADSNRYIEESVVLRNNALYYAFSFGMALSF